MTVALIGDVHNDTGWLRDRVESLPRHVRTVVQVGDLWVWPDPDDVPPHADGSPRELPKYPGYLGLHWRRPPRDICAIDGNHWPHRLTVGLTRPTTIAAGLLFLPRGTVMVLEGRHGPLRCGFLGGADSVLDRAWRTPGVDWWPDESIQETDVERLLENARSLGGLDLLVTHTPPATITTIMTSGDAPHPSAILVEEAWRALGGGVPDAPLEIVSGHMHAPYLDHALRVEVLDYLGVTLR